MCTIFSAFEDWGDAQQAIDALLDHGGALLALRIPSNDFTELGALEILAKYHATQNVFGNDV